MALFFFLLQTSCPERRRPFRTPLSDNRPQLLATPCLNDTVPNEPTSEASAPAGNGDTFGEAADRLDFGQMHC